MSFVNKTVSLYCPTCGNDQFSFMDEGIDTLSDAPDGTKIQCVDCKCIFTKAELIEANQNVISANIEEVKQDLLKDIRKKLKKF